MTTLALKFGIIAFDSRMTQGDLVSGSVVKGVKTAKYLAAAAGDPEDIRAYLDWVKDGALKSHKAKFGLNRKVNIEGICVSKDGTVTHYDGRLYPYKVRADFHAVGSGKDIAVGAMAAGASAYDAVKIAAKYDKNTGGRIRKLSF